MHLGCNWPSGLAPAMPKEWQLAMRKCRLLIDRSMCLCHDATCSLCKKIWHCVAVSFVRHALVCCLVLNPGYNWSQAAMQWQGEIKSLCKHLGLGHFKGLLKGRGTRPSSAPTLEKPRQPCSCFYRRWVCWMLCYGEEQYGNAAAAWQLLP